MIKIESTIPVFELSTIRQHVQNCAKEQWTNLKPERMVCVGLTAFPGAIQNTGETAQAVIEWYKDMRATFDLDLPESFIISFNSRNLILISSTLATFSE